MVRPAVPIPGPNDTTRWVPRRRYESSRSLEPRESAMRVTRIVLCSLLVASFGTMSAGPPTNVSLSDLAGSDRTTPRLRPGTLFSAHGLSVEVPGAGHGVWVDAVLASGGAVG